MFMKNGLSSNQLKAIAIAAMTLDHLVWTLFPGYDTRWFVLLAHIIGRLTAPIMWFFIAEGYHYTRNVKKYAIRLFSLAVISHFAYNFCFGIPFLPLQTSVFNQTGVVWSLAWGLVLLWIFDNNKIRDWQKRLAILLVCLITFPSDWSCIAAMAVLFIGTNRGNFKAQMLWMMVWTVVYAAVYFFFIDKVYALVQLGTCLTIPLLRLYNGQRGSWKGMGKLFYAYYPVHLFLCGLLRVLLWGAGFVTATANF
nr:conjugal transfer protein TraX [Oscillospiraceae bacterium]